MSYIRLKANTNKQMTQLIFNIATVQRRKKSFMGVLSALANQTVKCDKINVAMSYAEQDMEIFNFLKNNFKSFHILCRPSMQADVKMYAFDLCDDDSNFLTFDDDITYPVDYADRIVREIERTERKSVIGFHGIWFNRFPVTNYFAQRKLHQYFNLVSINQNVHVIGTGCCGFYVATLRKAGFSFSYFEKFKEYGNFNDMTFAQFLREKRIPMIVVSHPAQWMQIYPNTQDQHALWKQAKIAGKVTELLFLQKG